MRIRLQATRSPARVDARSRGFAMIASHRRRKCIDHHLDGGRPARAVPRGKRQRAVSASERRREGSQRNCRERQRPAIGAESPGRKAAPIFRSSQTRTSLGNSRPEAVNLDPSMPELPRNKRPNRSVSDLVTAIGLENADFGTRVGRMPIAERDGESPMHRRCRGAKRPRPEGPLSRQRRRHGSAATMRRALPRARRTAEAGRSKGAAREPGVTRRASCR